MLSRNVRRKRRKELNAKNFPSEVWAMRVLDLMGIQNYERNYPLLNIYFGDFVWIRAKIVLEIDGKSHDGKEDYDQRRDAFLKKEGWLVIRVKHNNKEELLAFVREHRKALERCARRRRVPTPYFPQKPKIKSPDEELREALKLINKERNATAVNDLQKRSGQFKSQLAAKKRVESKRQLKT